MKSFFKRVFGRLRHRRGYSKIIEHMEIDFVLSRLVSQHSINFLDVGAHHGEFIRILSNTNHPHKVNIQCIEPLPANLVRLRLAKLINSWRRNVSIQITRAAIGRDSGTVEFFLGSADTLFTSKKHWVEKFPNEFINYRTYSIQSYSFDDYLTQFSPNNANFDLVKIDTEGADLEVLQSILASKARIDSLIVEIDLEKYSDLRETLTVANFKEQYIFLRTGIPTVYLGEPLNQANIDKLLSIHPNLCGNIVAFKEN